VKGVRDGEDGGFRVRVGRGTPAVVACSLLGRVVSVSAGGPGAIVRTVVDLSRCSSLSSLSTLAGRHALRGPRRISSTVVDVARSCAQSLTCNR
jgi:hypothetical protein